MRTDFEMNRGQRSTLTYAVVLVPSALVAVIVA
jgi:hypothetical protein